MRVALITMYGRKYWNMLVVFCSVALNCCRGYKVYGPNCITQSCVVFLGNLVLRAPSDAYSWEGRPPAEVVTFMNWTKEVDFFLGDSNYFLYELRGRFWQQVTGCPPYVISYHQGDWFQQCIDLINYFIFKYNPCVDSLISNLITIYLCMHQATRVDNLKIRRAD